MARRRRIFFALWPDAGVRDALAAVAAPILKSCRGRPVPPENYHVTLRFLGSVDADALAAARAAAKATIGERFELVLDRLGHWPRPAVVWLGARGVDDRLLRLVANLNTELESRGFGPDPRPYRPHLTLMRKAAGAPQYDGGLAPIRWPVGGFCLVESRSESEGARYNPLESWPLGDV